jgi:choline dehydrogenase-like flavoprotein
VSEIPHERYNRNAKIFTGALDKLGFGWKPLHRAQGDCKLEHGSDCIVCLGGCPRDSKQSSLVTTIRKAREKGLQVVSELEVHRIECRADQVTIKGLRHGKDESYVARKVVLAAGALGNTSILLRSGFGKRLPALGRGFCCHPQYMTYALFSDPIDAHKGAFQAVKSEDRRFRVTGFKLENVFAPPIATAMLMPGFGRSHQKLMRKYRYMASMEVALRDEPSGVVKLAPSGKLLIDKGLSAADQRLAGEGLKLVRELFAASGAQSVVQCDQGFGLHLMGGCAIGVDPASSVVDPEFRVHGLPNLLAADSSVFPGAPGINPSFTVMALSERASRLFLSQPVSTGRSESARAVTP